MVIFFHYNFSVFSSAPKTPPSAAQEATQSPLEETPFIHSVKKLLLNKNYMLLLTSYGMNVGVFYAISTLLNPVRQTTNIVLDFFLFEFQFLSEGL